MPLKSWGALLEEAGDEISFDVLPAADYDLKIVKSEAKQTSGGKLMFSITCEVTSGPYAKRKVWGNLVLSPENPTALGIFFRQMNALGIDKSFFAANPNDSAVADALINREFRGQVAIRQWQGTDKNEIKNYFPISRTPGTPVPPPPPVVTPAANPAPAPAGATPAPAPATAPQSAAVAPPPPPPVPTEVAPPPPVQPATPPVADAVTPPPPPADVAAPKTLEAPF